MTPRKTPQKIGTEIATAPQRVLPAVSPMLSVLRTASTSVCLKKIMPLAPHLFGWVCALILCFSQPWGLTAADTKLDLAVNPLKFLSGALVAWTDTFTMGQLQNQAYGYLFPQGLFFLLTDGLPDWVAQRLWWTLVIGVGYSGFYLLIQRVLFKSAGLNSAGLSTVKTSSNGFVTACAVLGALGYVLSPRVLTTLTAISSETWPMMVAPWILAPFIRPSVTDPARGKNSAVGDVEKQKKQPLTKLPIRTIALSVCAVGMLGAVNATASLAACVPAGLYLLYRRHFKVLAGWLCGCALVSMWWIVPLLVLGHYSVNFTDYIESAGVTTHWLSLPEILRGTTSWLPFVDGERQAGTLLVSQPIFVFFTLMVAAAGLIGLRSICTHNHFWLFLFGVGLSVLGGAHLATDFLNGSGAALRNVHKFDLLIRMPLMLGIAALPASLGVFSTQSEVAADRGRESTKIAGIAQTVSVSKANATTNRITSRRLAGTLLVALCMIGASAPAWSTRLLPIGAYERIPDYWVEAAEFINTHAQKTRTLILPQASFARQEWGTTRDEPAQALLEVPWAVRDAIPLVDGDMIRSLSMTSKHPTQAQLERLGIGVVIVRHDLINTKADVDTLLPEADFPHREIHRFGQLDVVVLDTERGMLISAEDPVPVAGGGEVLSLLGPGMYQLVDAHAQIVTDTPMLTARNYGAIDSVSAPLATPAEGADVLNPVLDYQSAGPLTVVSTFGQVQASSSASDATNFGGAQAEHSLTASVDGDKTTAWYPQLGRSQGEWLSLTIENATGADIGTDISSMSDSTAEAELQQDHQIHQAHQARYLNLLTEGSDAEFTFEVADARITRHITVGKETRIRLPGQGKSVRIIVETHSRVGIAEAHIEGADISRVVTVANTSADVRQFLFQRLYSTTDTIIRRFTAPREMTVNIETSACSQEVLIDDTSYHCGDQVILASGVHELRTDSRWVSLTENDYSASGAKTMPFTGYVTALDKKQTIITHRAANPGLRGFIGETELQATTINSGVQGFIVPAGISGEFRMSFAGDHIYRLGLFIGGILWLGTMLSCLLLIRQRSRMSSPSINNAASTTASTSTSYSGYLAWLTVTLGLGVSTGWLALPIMAITWAVRRWTFFRASWIIGVLMALAALWVMRAPWPHSGYDSAIYLASLACVGAVTAVVLRR
ncbi:alpha-(1-_3)-arabinofuranosyltransferase family protein [Corynebacterium kutscheri]|uniref:alpha-(1->3)-arabinofuranosyltransferase domain-containing protein n=1 Tax=Corynebacterium kutscheri TaxID=35755 RepID=UPI0037C06166